MHIEREWGWWEKSKICIDAQRLFDVSVVKETWRKTHVWLWRCRFIIKHHRFLYTPDCSKNCTHNRLGQYFFGCHVTISSIMIWKFFLPFFPVLSSLWVNWKLLLSSTRVIFDMRHTSEFKERFLIVNNRLKPLSENKKRRLYSQLFLMGRNSKINSKIMQNENKRALISAS